MTGTHPERGARLLTGVPGFLPLHILGLLARHDDLHCFVLVAPEWTFEARRACLAVEALTPSFTGRWTVVVGDLQARDLALPASGAVGIRDAVTELWHLSAEDDPNAAEGDAYRNNVMATRHVVEFAAGLPHLQRLVFGSSASVCGLRSGRVYEDELDVGQRFANVCEATRCWAEAEVRAASAAVPTVILRPTWAVGPWRYGRRGPGLGRAPVAASLRAADARQRRALGTAIVPVLPATYLAEAMVKLGTSARAIGRTFHLADPAPCSVSEAAARVGHAWFAPRPPHSLACWTARARWDLSNTAELLGDFGPPAADVVWQGIASEFEASSGHMGRQP